MEKAFQDYYPEHMSHCYGCGRLNEFGYRIKSYWDLVTLEQESPETICTFTPQPYHIAIPGFVYGGLIASLIDCHGTGSAAAFAYRQQGRAMDTLPPLRFVTASLHVDYLRPTPLGDALELRGKALEIKGRKVVVEIQLSVQGEVCARGQVVAIQLPEQMMPSERAAAKSGDRA